ncbi:MAG: hypothetical protein QM820_44945 [Minicystis sp.]
MLDITLGRDGSAAGVEQIGAALAARGPLLLVLDNFESVITHASATVGQWLRQAPEARFLVTSRERLHLAGEIVFDLGPLSMPDGDGDAGACEAVQLFVERARAVQRSYTLTDEEAPRVVELVRALDGNALAIELAAARMRVLTTADSDREPPAEPRRLRGQRRRRGATPPHPARRRRLVVERAQALGAGGARAVRRLPRRLRRAGRARGPRSLGTSGRAAAD